MDGEGIENPHYLEGPCVTIVLNIITVMMMMMMMMMIIIIIIIIGMSNTTFFAFCGKLHLSTEKWR